MSTLTRERELYASAARTASPTTHAPFQFDGFNACHIVINVTSVTDTPIVTPTIQGLTEGGTAYSILVATAITATGITVLKVGPGIAPLSGGAAADYLPRRWRLQMTHTDADSITYSVAAILFGGSNG